MHRTSQKHWNASILEGNTTLDPNHTNTLSLYCNMLPSLNSIYDQQVHQTQITEAAITHLLEYVSNNPDSVVKF